jgi:hypothetical protein
MPLYHFNIYHDHVTIDDEGTELTDKDAAWKEATHIAGESIKDIDGKLRPGHDWRLEVTDEFLNPLWEISVAAAKK